MWRLHTALPEGSHLPPGACRHLRQLLPSRIWERGETAAGTRLEVVNRRIHIPPTPPPYLPYLPPLPASSPLLPPPTHTWILHCTYSLSTRERSRSLRPA